MGAVVAIMMQKSLKKPTFASCRHNDIIHVISYVGTKKYCDNFKCNCVVTVVKLDFVVITV